MLDAQSIWDSHPFPDSPCDTTYFKNQCAIRMSVALRGAGADLKTFQGAKCYPALKHSPKHVLRAQELANWLVGQTNLVGQVKKFKNVTHIDFVGRKGIVFIKDGWGPTDHIDIWDGSRLKGGDISYFQLGKEVWFWQL